MRDAVRKNMIVTLVVWLLLFGAGMAVMLQTAFHKTIVIAEAAQERTGLGENPGQTERQSTELVFQEAGGEKNHIYIPLESGVKAENVFLENRYMDREVWIYLKDGTEEFYGKEAIYGDISPLLAGSCERQEEGILLKLQAQRIYEYRSTMENGRMVLEFQEPGAVYEKIVVVDPAGGGSESGLVWGELAEKDIALQTALLLQKRMWQSDVKVYFTRLEDVEVSRKERLALAQEVGADFYLSIGVSVDEGDPSGYGIRSFYNEEYYIPEFGNVQFADIVTRHVAVSSVNRALGLFPAEQDSILAEIEIPAAQLCVGYLSNEKEAALLGQEAYLEKIAAGIEDAIGEAYGNGK